MDATVKRTALETFDVPGSKYETVMMLVELPPLTKTGFHTHPGFNSRVLPRWEPHRRGAWP